MILRFKGIVKCGDRCRVDESDDSLHGALHIEGRDVIAEIHAAIWRGPVTVATADERWTGQLAVECGWGYSEHTPMDSDSLKVGPHDLIDIIEKHKGKNIYLWISDEAVNLLEYGQGCP